jgi:hypothetical protein
MSNTILAPFVLLLIPGVLLLILGKSRQPTASQRKRLRRGGILCGIAFTYFGLATIIGTKMSARPEVIQTAEEAKDFVLVSETKDVVRTKPSAALNGFIATSHDERGCWSSDD